MDCSWPGMENNRVECLFELVGSEINLGPLPFPTRPNDAPPLLYLVYLA